MTGFVERFNTVKCLKSSLLTLKTLPKPGDCPSLLVMTGTRSQTAQASQSTGKKRGNGKKPTRPKKKQKNQPRKQSRKQSSPNPDASDSDDSDNGPKSDSPIELTPPPIIPDYRNCKFLPQFTTYLDKDRVGGLGETFNLEEMSYDSAMGPKVS